MEGSQDIIVRPFTGLANTSITNQLHSTNECFDYQCSKRRQADLGGP